MSESSTSGKEARVSEFLERSIENSLAGSSVLRGNFSITPEDKAAYLIERLRAASDLYKHGSAEEKIVAAIEIERIHSAASSHMPPHIFFAQCVFEAASVSKNTNVSTATLARNVIEFFRIFHVQLAAKLDPALVEEALKAPEDVRKARGQKTRWVALAEAWATTGDKKKQGTFKTQWITLTKNYDAWSRGHDR